MVESESVRVLIGSGIVLTLLCVFATSAIAGDAAQDLNSTLQKARSRMMGMQIDQAVDLYAQATEQLQALEKSDPGHARLADLRAKYAKLTRDLEKKVTQRAARDIQPMQKALVAAESKGDAGAIAAARTKLGAALEKHRRLLEVAGGASGAAMLAGAAAALAGESAEGKAPEGGEGPPVPTDPAPPKPAATTPAPTGDPKAIYGEIQRAFRSTRTLGTAELVAAAVEIRALIEQLRAADPDHRQLASFEQKIDKLIADAYAADVRGAEREIARRIRKIGMYLERNQENERPQLAEQRRLLAEVLDQHRAALEAAGAKGSELIAQTETALKEADAKIGAALAGDALVSEWVDRLQAYIRGGAKDITPGINGDALYVQVQAWRKEAAETLEAYRKVEFAKGKTRELERAEESLVQSMKDADYNLAYAVTSRAEALEAHVQRITAMFAGDQAWRQDRSTPPTRFADEQLDELRRRIEELRGYQADHPLLAKADAEYTKLLAENEERRSAAKAQTFLEPDRYEGSDAAALKAFAKARVPEDHAGATVLRVTLFTPEWKEESVVEWTDTSRTRLRTRTTRTLMFCVAFESQGAVFRDFGYLNQDRKADGGWGPVYGHCAKFRAPMLKENVDR